MHDDPEILKRRIAILEAELALHKGVGDVSPHKDPFFEVIFNHLSQFTLLLTPEGIVVEVNGAALKLANLDRHDVIHRPLWECPWWQGSEEAQILLRHHIQRAARGEPVRYETQVCGTKQRYIDLDLHLCPILDQRHVVMSIVLEGRNLSRVKRLQSECELALSYLQESQYRFETLSSAAPVGIFKTDPTGICVYANDRYCEIVGIADADQKSLKKSWVEYLHPDDRDSVTAQWHTALQGYQPFQTECRFQHSAAAPWVYIQAAPQYNRRLDLLGYIGTITDITPLKESQLALTELNTQLEARVAERTAEIHLLMERQSLALKAGSLGWWEWDIQSDRLFWDDLLYTLHGLTPIGSALVYGDWLATLHPDDRPTVTAIMTRALLPREAYRADFSDPDSYEFEYRVIWPSGQIRFLKAHGLSVYDAEGIPYRVTGVSLDITDWKEFQQQLKIQNEELAQANAELEQATRLKDEFLANMSHELRTPLNAILGLSESLSEGIYGALEDNQQRAIEMITTSGEHLLELINDILDLAKVAANKVDLEMSCVNLRELCEQCLLLVRPQGLKKQLDLNLTFPDRAIAMPLDARRIRQALINLLGNAVKFTPSGGQITLAVEVEPQSVSFHVMDTGIGIAEEHLDKLFQPFSQVDSKLNRLHNGTGLGLALVKHIAELHGGSVKVQSTLGQGSCFTIAIPYSQFLLGENIPPSSLCYVPLEAVAAIKVLVADDNQETIAALDDYLSAQGYHLSFANNGAEAIHTIEQHPPDVVIMDIQMPCMDGLEAIKTLRGNPAYATLPIIALTAFAMDSDRDRCLAAGATTYLSKPLRLSQLDRIIRSLVDCKLDPYPQ